jgi:hypothetical protein
MKIRKRYKTHSLIGKGDTIDIWRTPNGKEDRFVNGVYDKWILLCYIPYK